MLGDSLSAAYGIKTEQGWVRLLERRLAAEQRPHTIINASIGGETSGGGLARLEPLLARHRPAVLVIELGANDGLRGLPLKLMQANLEAMIQLGKQYRAHILLVGVQIPLNYGPRYTTLFQQSFTDIATRHHIALLPSLLGDIPLQPALMQADGLHPTAAAQPLILERIWPALKPLLPSPGAP